MRASLAEKLVGKVQEVYGRTREQAEKEYADWVRKCEASERDQGAAAPWTLSQTAMVPALPFLADERTPDA